MERQEVLMEEVFFDVLDELYFVTPYEDLQNAVDYNENELKEAILSLVEKGWVLVYKTMDEEIEEHNLDIDYKSYCYLASKKGLLAHNRA